MAAAQRFRGWKIWLGIFLIITPKIIAAQSADEYEIKAAFLYNFTKFVEWPHNDSDTFDICILGDDPFGSTIDQLVKGKTANGKKIEVRRIKDAEEGRLCQIVYVRPEEKAKGLQLLEAVQKLPVLTVTERGRSGKFSCIVQMSMVDDHIGLAINAAAAEASGLKISAKLLTLAKVSEK
jgi:hypothetical protein